MLGSVVGTRSLLVVVEERVSAVGVGVEVEGSLLVAVEGGHQCC